MDTDTNRPPATPALRVGFLGLGIMGSRMAANLAAAGHPLTVWTHTPGKAAAWAREHAGATATRTPAEVGAACDVAITMLVDGEQVAATLLGPEGVVAGAAPEDVERARPLFDAMGELFVHVGDVGQGQMLKLINNAVAAANAATVAQALIAADATGVDLQDVVTVLSAGAGGSTMLDLKAGPMREHDYTTLFKLDHMLKDVRLCLQETHAAGVPFPAAAATAEALVAAQSRGLGDADFAAMLEAFEGLAGRRL